MILSNLGQSVTVEFPFKNEGKNDLKILKVKSKYRCTATTPSKNYFEKRRKNLSLKLHLIHLAEQENNKNDYSDH